MLKARRRGAGHHATGRTRGHPCPAPASATRPHLGGPGLGASTSDVCEGGRWCAEPTPRHLRSSARNSVLHLRTRPARVRPCSQSWPRLHAAPLPAADSPLLSRILQPSVPSCDVHASQVCPQAAPVGRQAEVSLRVCVEHVSSLGHTRHSLTCAHTAPLGASTTPSSLRSGQGSHTAHQAFRWVACHCPQAALSSAPDEPPRLHLPHPFRLLTPLLSLLHPSTCQSDTRPPRRTPAAKGRE